MDKNWTMMWCAWLSIRKLRNRLVFTTKTLHAGCDLCVINPEPWKKKMILAACQTSLTTWAQENRTPSKWETENLPSPFKCNCCQNSFIFIFCCKVEAVNVVQWLCKCLRAFNRWGEGNVWGFMWLLLLFGLYGNIFVRFGVNNEQQNKHMLE